MTVAELIVRLKKMPQDALVVKEYSCDGEELPYTIEVWGPTFQKEASFPSKLKNVVVF